MIVNTFSELMSQVAYNNSGPLDIHNVLLQLEICGTGMSLIRLKLFCFMFDYFKNSERNVIHNMKHTRKCMFP